LLDSINYAVEDDKGGVEDDQDGDGGTSSLVLQRHICVRRPVR
jgi:hypothetical protein